MKRQIKIIKQLYEGKKERFDYWNKNKIQKLFLLMQITIVNLIKILKILLNRYAYIRQVEFVLTTRCTLRCRDCANLMQYYDKPYDVDLNDVKQEIYQFLKFVDEVDKLILIGGEPFIYPQLKELLTWLFEQTKYNSIHFYTNGTIIPSENIIKLLKNEKVFVIIGDYGTKISKIEELCSLFDKENIRYRKKIEDNFWFDLGGLYSRNRTDMQLKQQFCNCKIICRSILKGKLFFCSRATHLNDLEIINSDKAEYVDIMKEDLSTNEIMDLIYRDTYIGACNYCNFGTAELVKIEPGIQKNCV